jgi:hypothetical protein
MASTIRADQFVELYAQDVREFPDAYKQRVRLDPEGSARSLIDGLDESEIAQMLRDLKHERRTVKKHESGGNPYFYVVYQGKIGRVVESRRDAEDIARSDYEGVTRVVGRGGLRGLGLDPDRPSDWTSATSRSRASAARHERGGNPSTSGAKAGMRLVYLPVNAAWVFLFGDDLRTAQIITLSSEERFIRSRKDAVAAAKRHGLAVSKSGAVTASGPNPFAQEWSSPSSLHRLMKHESGGNPFDRELAARVKALVGGKK